MNNWIDIKDDPIGDLKEMADTIRANSYKTLPMYMSKEFADELIESGCVKSGEIRVIDLLGDNND